MADDDNRNENEKPETGTPKGSESSILADLARERDKRQALEAKLAELQPLAEKAQQLEDASKSELQRLQEQLTAVEDRAKAAEAEKLRIEVAAEKGLKPSQARRLAGTTKEELEKDADDMLADFTPGKQEQPPGRPKEALRGSVNTDGADQPATGAVADNWIRQQLGVTATP